MKLSKLFLTGILGITLVFGTLLFTGCSPGGDDGSGGNNNGDGGNNNDALFTEKADGKLLVNNTSADALVLFYDTITSSRLLGCNVAPKFGKLCTQNWKT
ncbi:MAG: hypothetical protein LBB61_00795 [Treponema sp.]|jgi:hypothetical protein|nr:hypothetical protein [Treponema sp.]